MMKLLKEEKEQVKQWIAALRSGKYKQNTDGYLQNENGYCCLGVACELFGKNLQMHYDGTMFGTHPSHQGPNIPNWLYDFHIKFQNISGHFLINLNDINKLSFSEIADIIETELNKGNL